MISIGDNIGSTVLFVGIRVAGEFSDYSLVAISSSKYVCSNASHKDTSVTTVCCFARVFSFC